jgi:hypothetical protein
LIREPPFCMAAGFSAPSSSGAQNRAFCVRHEAHCYIARVAGMDWRRCLWI